MDGGRRWLSGAVLALLASVEARGECLSLKSGPMIYDVQGCGAVQPEQTFDVQKEKYRWIGGLDAAGRKSLFDSYRGLYLKGKVVKSQVVEKGLATEEGRLGGETILLYVPPGQQTCAGVLGKRVAGNLREICCDGGGDPPCLLNTSYVLSAPKVLGSAGTSAGDASRQKAAKSKDYVQGTAAFQQRKWKDAVKAFEQARAKGELDIKGHYRLGVAYRELDQCRDAVAPLRFVHEQREKKAIFADEESVARDAGFLLARCHSKMNEPGAAVLLLNSYLLEPQKYKKEIKESLSHKDFGWIHTSKEYREYKAEARKRL